MLATDLALIRLLLCLVIARNFVLCAESSTSPKPIETPEVVKVPEVPVVPEASQEVPEASQVVPEASQVVHTSVTPIKPRIIQRTTILKRANRFHYRDNSTSTSKLSNYEEDDSTPTTHLPNPVSFESTTAKIVDFRASTHLGEINDYETTEHKKEKPRMIQRTTVLKRGNRFHYQDNSTSTSKVPNYEEVDSTLKSHFPGRVSLESATRKTVDFRPSIHLGEIGGYETRKSSTNPFNKLQHVNFENSVRIGELNTDGVRAPLVPIASSSFHEADRTATVEERKKNYRVKFFETDSRYGVAVPVEEAHQQQEYFEPQQQNEQHTANNDDDNNNDSNDNNGNNYDNGYNYPAKIPVGHEAFVTFQYPQSHYGEVTARPMTLGRPVYPSMMSEQIHVQHYEPGMHNVQTIYVKPSKFQGEVEIVTPAPVQPAHVQIQHYEYVTPASGEAFEKPEVLHHQGSYQVVPQEADTDNVGKPETIMYLTSHRETAYTRMKKFPYQFYHPGLGHNDNEHHFVQEGPHAFPSKARRISPWKKILHLIGTFIPLGLLLATLTPNVVKIGNTTQPNIVLSKLRVVDLPVEHKRGRLVDEPDNQQPNTCEDRSICELIVSGSEPRSNLLQNILWTLTTKSTDEEARKHGLHEIFAAVKRKDCSIIDC